MMRLQLHRCPWINQVGQVGQLASFLFRSDDSGLFSDSLISSLRYKFPHLAACCFRARKGRYSTSSKKTRLAGNWSRVAATRCGLHGAVVEHTCGALIYLSTHSYSGTIIAHRTSRKLEWEAKTFTLTFFLLFASCFWIIFFLLGDYPSSTGWLSDPGERDDVFLFLRLAENLTSSS